MANFEEEMAKKIKEQLENGELDNFDNNENSTETIETDELEANIENVTEVQQESKIIDNSINGKDIISKALGIKNTKTNHFERKEKVRPLAIIVGVLSLILCLGIIAVMVFAIVKLAVPMWGIVSNLFGIFFNEQVLIFSLGIGCIFGGVVIILVVGFFLAVLMLFVSLAFTTIGIPIVAFKTSRLPKQVFAHEADSIGNMIYSYVLGLLVGFLGFAMFMDGSLGYVSYITLVTGIVFLVIAILLTIDLIMAKKAYNKLQDQQEKAEIKQEAMDIKSAKKARQRNRKMVGKLLGKLFAKK